MRRKPFDLVEKGSKSMFVVENYYITANCRNPLIDVEKRSNIIVMSKSTMNAVLQTEPRLCVLMKPEIGYRSPGRSLR